MGSATFPVGCAIVCFWGKFDVRCVLFGFAYRVFMDIVDFLTSLPLDFGLLSVCALGCVMFHESFASAFLGRLHVERERCLIFYMLGFRV